MSNARRKVLVGGFAAGAALLTAGSAAFACVPFKGQLQVNVFDPSGGGGISQNSGTAVANGRTVAGDVLGYCGNGPSQPNSTNPGWTTAAEAQADGGDIITVSVSAATCALNGGSNSSFPGGNYSVIINNAKTAAATPFTLTGSSWSIVAGKGCFTSATPTGNITLDTAFSVNGTGSGTRTYTLPSMNRIDVASTGAASALCVGKGGTLGPVGIFVPIIIESTV